MKNLLLLLVLLFVSHIVVMGQYVEKKLMYGGAQRTYLQYTPTTIAPADEAPVLFLLHGLGDDINNFTSAMNLLSEAEQRGWILVFPQALNATVLTYNLGTFWNAGLSLVVMGMPISPNSNVDDVGFLMAVLDEVESNTAVDADSVFFAGFSLGGIMCHKMAVEHGDRIKGVASVAGALPQACATATPVESISVLHIHGTGDQVLSYENAAFTIDPYGTFSIGLGAEASVEYWRAFNQCDDIPLIEFYPDTQNDGMNFELYTYRGGNGGSRVALLKAVNGDHECYIGDSYDIDYRDEIIRFFTDKMDPTTVKSITMASSLRLCPNPASNMVHVIMGASENDIVEVADLIGRVWMRQPLHHGGFDVSTLPSGVYIVRMASDQSRCVKLVVE